MGWFHLPLDVERMRAAAQALVGEHDFSAFRAAECQAKTPVRQLAAAAIERHGDYVVFEFSANAFLHHMVRNIVGWLVYVGKGAAPPEWVAEVLAGRDRSRAAPTFGPAGLYLAGVTYPARWGLPAFPPMLPFVEAAAMRTRVKICGITRPRTARGGPPWRARDRLVFYRRARAT